MHEQQDPRRFFDDVEAAILEFGAKADACGPVFVDRHSLPADVQSGLGVVTSYVTWLSVEKELQVFRASIEAAIGAYKTRSAAMTCDPDHPFQEEQWAYPCPYESEERPYPDGQHWLAEHVGKFDGQFFRADPQMSPLVVFPYEVSLQDDSFQGLNGVVDIRGTPLIQRRPLAIIGMCVFWARSLVDRLEGCLVRKARPRNLDGQKILALPVGGVLEVMLRDLNMEDAASLHCSAIMDDPVLMRPRSYWCLHQPPTSLLNASFGSAASALDPPSLLEEATEWNELGCGFDLLDRKEQIHSALCQQLLPFIFGTQRFALDLDELLIGSPYLNVWNGDRVMKRSLVRDYLSTIPPRFAALEYAAKRRFIHKAEEIYEGYGLMAALPHPEHLIFPGEQFLHSAGNCYLNFMCRNEDFDSYSRAAKNMGDAVLRMREGFIKIGHAFQQCRPLNLTYDNAPSPAAANARAASLRARRRPTRSVLCQAISCPKFNRMRKVTVGADLVYTTAPRFMHYSSPQVSTININFPEDEIPRRFHPNYPDGQP